MGPPEVSAEDAVGGESSNDPDSAPNTPAGTVVEGPAGLDDCLVTGAAGGEKRRRKVGQQLDLFGNVTHSDWQAPGEPEELGLYIAAGEIVVTEAPRECLPIIPQTQSYDP